MLKAVTREYIERTVRKYLPVVIDQVAKRGIEPRDLWLLLGKYDADQSAAVIPRLVSDQVLDLARTPTQRKKMTRLLAKPCEPNDLLVIITARSDVVGHWLRVPVIVPKPTEFLVWYPKFHAND